MKEPVDPKISQYFSELAKKRKRPYYGFKDPKLAREAGKRGRQTQAKIRKEAKGD